MDRIWKETLKRLDDLEKSVELIHTFLANKCQSCKVQTEPESQVDTVDLPKIV